MASGSAVQVKGGGLSLVSAIGLDDPAAMFFDFRIDERLPMPLQLSERAVLVRAQISSFPPWYGTV
jgi:hypothetical protein